MKHTFTTTDKVGLAIALLTCLISVISAAWFHGLGAFMAATASVLSAFWAGIYVRSLSVVISQEEEDAKDDPEGP